MEKDIYSKQNMGTLKIQLSGFYCIIPFQIKDRFCVIAKKI